MSKVVGEPIINPLDVSQITYFENEVFKMSLKSCMFQCYCKRIYTLKSIYSDAFVPCFPVVSLPG